MKDLYNLLESYFKNDKEIDIFYNEKENMIIFNQNNQSDIFNLYIFIRDEYLIIDDFDLEDYNEENEEYERIELFRINSILYELNNNKLNLLILNFIQDFIDIIE